MKKQSFLLLCLFALLTFGCSSKKTAQKAETTTTQKANNQASERGQRGNIQAEMDKLMAKLNLSDEQVEKFKTLEAEYRKKMQTARENNQGDRMATRAAMQALRKEQTEATKGILDADQFKLYQESMKEIRNQRRGSRGGPRGRGGQ